MFLVVITDSKSNNWGKTYHFVSESFVKKESEIECVLDKYQDFYSVDIFNWDGKKTTPLTNEQVEKLFGCEKDSSDEVEAS